MSDDVIQIAPVARESSKLVIGLAGQSGEGKTYSALKLALGLTDFNPERIGFLDCENGRGKLYASIFGDRKFKHATLVPPFSPARYISAIRQFANADIDVLIIDSISHEYEGEGGVEEIAHSAVQRGKKVPDWITAKREHKRFMNTLLYVSTHIIACVRAREKTDFKTGSPTSLGIQPITEKNVMYEMSFSFLLSERGKKRSILKLSDDFENLVGYDGYLTSDHGKALRDWLGEVDPLERSRGTLRLAASKGTEDLKMAWSLIPSNQKKALASFKDTLKDLAEHADKEAALPQQSTDEPQGENIVW